MSSTDIRSIQRNLQELDSWLADLRSDLGVDDEGAFQALHAGLRVLRDRLTPTEATDLGAQLPIIVRGAYYDQWRLSQTPKKIRDTDSFLELVAAAHPGTSDPKTLMRAVIRTLHRHIDRGQLDQVYHMLPSEIRDEIWSVPEAA